MNKEEFMKFIGKRIKKFRIANDMTQEELALNAYINPAYFGAVERGLKCPTVYTLYRLTDALGISLSEFFNVKDLPIEMVNESERVNELISRIPDNKKDKLLKIIEAIIPLI